MRSLALDWLVLFGQPCLPGLSVSDYLLSWGVGLRAALSFCTLALSPGFETRAGPCSSRGHQVFFSGMSYRSDMNRHDLLLADNGHDVTVQF